MAGSNKSNNAPRMYYPKALVPGYMGQFIPVKHAQEMLRDGLGVKHYYSETLSMSSSDGGSQKAPYSPKPDIVAANNIVNIREMLRPPKTYKRYPQYYVKYATPTVLDGTQARTVQIPDLPERSLVGRYYRHSDTIYKK
uniref:Uncharacterized protein n=1 Tax=Timema cristinae TaxID=61476 RepID=A0A7R9CRB4_TIMCR|nr:unnamed protein product [Timema cristinae]